MQEMRFLVGFDPGPAGGTTCGPRGLKPRYHLWIPWWDSLLYASSESPNSHTLLGSLLLHTQFSNKGKNKLAPITMLCYNNTKSLILRN